MILLLLKLVVSVFGVDNIIIDSQSASIYPLSMDPHIQTTLSLLDINETLMLLMLPLLQRCAGNRNSSVGHASK